jgi:large subunit ribosomal protein L4
MRRKALDSAILAKLLGQDLCVVEGLKLDEPQTGRMAGLLKNLDINRTCLLALGERDRNIYLSSRNISDLTVRTAGELNAYDVATRMKMIVTSEAMEALCKREPEKKGQDK